MDRTIRAGHLEKLKGETMKARHLLLACLLAAVTLVFTSADLSSCGPFFDGAVFSDRNSPEISFEEYATGQLGIIHSTYYRTYLLVAYRNLSGRPLSNVQQKAFLGRNDGGSESRWIQTGSFYEPEAVKNWRDARAEVSGVQSTGALEIYRKVATSEWQTYLNCTEGAFRNAASTLHQRIRT